MFFSSSRFKWKDMETAAAGLCSEILTFLLVFPAPYSSILSANKFCTLNSWQHQGKIWCFGTVFSSKLRSNQKSKVAKPWSAIAIYFRFVGGLGVTKTILYQMHECHQFKYSCKNVIYTPTWWPRRIYFAQEVFWS